MSVSAAVAVAAKRARAPRVQVRRVSQACQHDWAAAAPALQALRAAASDLRPLGRFLCTPRPRKFRGCAIRAPERRDALSAFRPRRVVWAETEFAPVRWQGVARAAARTYRATFPAARLPAPPSDSVNRCNWATATPSAPIIRPPTAAVVPATMSVLPKLNSLIGMPYPTIATPSITAMAPTTYNTTDMSVTTPSCTRRIHRPARAYRVTCYAAERIFPSLVSLRNW